MHLHKNECKRAAVSKMKSMMDGYSGGGSVPTPKPKPHPVPIPRSRPESAVRQDPSVIEEAKRAYRRFKYGNEDKEIIGGDPDEYGKFKELLEKGQQDIATGGRVSRVGPRTLTRKGLNTNALKVR